MWLYAIHSKNAELIHLLESNEVQPPKSESKEEKTKFLLQNLIKIKKKNSSQNYEQCLIESIKCHHNDIADYIENNFIDQTEINSRQNEKIISNCIEYHNYSRFKNASIIDHGLFYLSFYRYDKLFELLLKEKEKSIKNKVIQYPKIKFALITAAESNEVEVIYHHLLKIQDISGGLFKHCIIKQIVIPSSVTSIGNSAFKGCSSLTQITIPSSLEILPKLNNVKIEHNKSQKKDKKRKIGIVKTYRLLN